MAPPLRLPAARRLWGWPHGVPDPNRLKDEAGKLVDETKEKAGDAANQAGNAIGDAAGQVSNHAQASFNFVKDTINNAKKVVEEGIRVVTSAADAGTEFVSNMTHLFQKFGPLQPIFGATHGIVPLLTSQRNLGILVNFTAELLDSASSLVDIGNAVGTVGQVFGQLFNLFNNELAKLSNKGGPGRRLFVDYTALLGGLNFDQLKKTFEDFHARAQLYVKRVLDVNRTVAPLLSTLRDQLNGRRLGAEEIYSELQSSQQKYEGAILSVVPTWQDVENLAIEVCGQTDSALNEVSSLKCRVEGFANQVQLPGAGGIQNIVDDCGNQVSQEVKAHEATCPGAAQSEAVRDMLSESAGVLGWFAVSFEYSARNSDAVRIMWGVIFLMLGIALACFGYRYKDCEFWIEGFLAGMVVWSVIISVIIVYFGVCRGRVIDTCEPMWLGVIVVFLSAGCAVATVKAQKMQLFLAGFDLGAILGGFLYISEFHEQIFETFISADSQETRVIMAGFLAAALVTGVILGALTVVCEKIIIVVGTAAIGGFIMVTAFGLFYPHWFGWYDFFAWFCLTVLASCVQFRCTAHGGGDSSSDEEEEDPRQESKPLFGC